MKKDKEPEKFIIQDFSDELIGRQSERTTFAMSLKSFDALDWLTEQYDITQKEALDVITKYYVIAVQGEDLTRAMEEMRKKYNLGETEDLVRKTMVISKKALQIIKELANAQAVNKNKILEALILMYQENTRRSVEEERKKIKRAKSKTMPIRKMTEEVKVKVEKMLGKNHDFTIALYLICELYNVLEIKDGKLDDEDRYRLINLQADLKQIKNEAISEPKKYSFRVKG